VANIKMKAKVVKGNVDFVLSLGATTGFVKEPFILDTKLIQFLPTLSKVSILNFIALNRTEKTNHAKAVDSFFRPHHNSWIIFQL